MAEPVTGSSLSRVGFEENRQTAGYSSDQEVTNAATILCEVSGSNIGQQAQSNDENSEDSETGPSERRSRRKRKPVRRLSPLEEEPSEEVSGEDNGTSTSSALDGDGTSTPSRAVAKRAIRLLNAKKDDERAQRGSEHFCCDYCQSKFIIPPQRKKRPGRRSWRVGVRYWIDPKTNKRLRLCNACGLRASRNQNPSAEKAEPASMAERKEYFETVQKFSQSLINELNDPDAERLTCPYFRTRTPCSCIQKFIVGDGTKMDEAKKRARHLLQLVKEAQRLRSKKFYNVEEVMKMSKKQRKVGIGNGQRKSKEYEELVLSKRAVLKDQLKFCEHATKRILLYSNNFLHKRLKTDPDMSRRLAMTRGGSKRSLRDIDQLPQEDCCDDRCVLLAETHKVLLKKWRDRAREGQMEARKVLGEMLTPSGLKTNCYKFITMVTGCSTCTIARVEEQMRKTGGDREPPPHGLKKYWETQPRAAKPTKKPVEPVIPPSISLATGQRNPLSQTLLDEKQLKEQLMQLKRMQQQLQAQQNQVNQQQKLIEKQLNMIERNKQKTIQDQQQQQQQQQQRPLQSQTQFTIQQQQPPQAKDMISIPAMTASDGSLDAIDPRVQQNMNQLLLEIQNQIASQQVLQQLMSVSEDGSQATPSSAATIEQPPPSYNVAMALSNGVPTSQQAIPGQVILQALPVTGGDTITIHTQPLEPSTGGGSEPTLQMVSRNANHEPTEDRSQVASAQSFLVSIPDMIEVDSLDQDTLPEVIGIPESGTFTDQLTEALETRAGNLPNQSHLGPDSTEVRLLNDLETMSNMNSSTPTRSSATILRKKTRTLLPVTSVSAGFPRNILRTACDPSVSLNAGTLPVAVSQIQPSCTPRPLTELPGDMLMPSEPLHALTSTSQGLVLQSIPVTATIRKQSSQGQSS